jgi:hypothetical protein
MKILRWELDSNFLVPVLIFVSQLAKLPSQSYDTVPLLDKKLERAKDPARDVHTSDDELFGDDEVSRLR